MRESEFLQALHFNSLQLPDGRVSNQVFFFFVLFVIEFSQSIPIVLPATADDKARLAGQPAITLVYKDAPVAILRQVMICWG